MGPSPTIRTPDQRLRVFVSSTLRELAPERVRTRAAIERLHLAPVMFELGARPHAPRDLYRAYLAQSDVFVGIYASRYGWVAPGETVSGLEDEYDLSGALPKLIYIQAGAEREDRLEALLARIRDDDTASYTSFDSVDGLGELIESDLATLLAERFDRSVAAVGAAPSGSLRAAADMSSSEGSPADGPGRDAFPSPTTDLIGRADELGRLRELVRRDDARLVTVTGPGGMGKSRLVAEVGRHASGEFPGGVWFVDLAPVSDPESVAGAVAQALGVRDTGDAPLLTKITTALARRRALVVIDNFEQVLPAASIVTSILSAAPDVHVLVASRSLLRISGEHALVLGPLSPPPAATTLTVQQAETSASVRLFVARARAVAPDFELTEANVGSVARLVTALDGVPLALELAAARVRILPPAAMVERLDRSLPLLTGGVSDLPLRQQTLRATIDWSTRLLRPAERRLLAELGVFVGGFSLAAVEGIATPDADADVLTLLGALVDSSLVRQQELDQEARFTVLATVREYAREELEASGLLDERRAAHAAWFVGLAARARHELFGPRQAVWIARLGADGENLRAAERWWLDRRDWEAAAGFAWSLWVYWWIDGHLGEVRGWMDEVLAAAPRVEGVARAQALYFIGAIRFWQQEGRGGVTGLTESVSLFHDARRPSFEALALVSLTLASLAEGDTEAADDQAERSVTLFRGADDLWGEAMALVTLGLVAMMRNKLPRALNRFEESLALAVRQGDELGAAIAVHHCGWAHLALGDLATGRVELARGLAASVRLHHAEGIAYGLEGLVAVALVDGDVERGGRLAGAARSLREETGLYNAASFSFHAAYETAAASGPDAATWASSHEVGLAMGAETAIALATAP